jgi:hypothetical protein
MPTRREFLRQVGTGVAATGFLPDLIETTGSHYPEYPTVPSETQEPSGHNGEQQSPDEKPHIWRLISGRQHHESETALATGRCG